MHCFRTSISLFAWCITITIYSNLIYNSKKLINIITFWYTKHQMGFFPVLFHDYLFTKFHPNHFLVALKKDCTQPVIPKSKMARKPNHSSMCCLNRNSRGWFPVCDMSRLVKTTDSMSVSQDQSIATFKKMTFRYHQLQITLKSVDVKSFQAKKTLGRHSKWY